MSSSLFQRGTSLSGIVRTESGKERLNASGNIVLKRHETEESQAARMQRIHLKVLIHPLIFVDFVKR